VFEVACLGGEVDLVGADEDLDRVGERVQEAGEAGDEGGLLLGASQEETGAVRGEQLAEAAACEFDESASEDAADGDVERRGARLARLAGKWRWQSVGGEQASLRRECEAGDRESELVAGKTVVADERNKDAGRRG
jgi:hypothetical protein